jgi:hypothetical protein
MCTTTQDSVLARLPVAELQASLRTFLAPLTERLPDARLPAVAELMVHGIIASQSPLITQIARGAGHEDASVWPRVLGGFSAHSGSLAHRRAASSACAMWRSSVAGSPRLTSPPSVPSLSGAEV